MSGSHYQSCRLHSDSIFSRFQITRSMCGLKTDKSKRWSHFVMRALSAAVKVFFSGWAVLAAKVGEKRE